MRKEFGMLVALIVMSIIIAISNSDFYGEANILNTTRQIAMLSIFAIGVSFVITTGGIDLSVGSVIGLSGVVLARISAPATGSGLASGAGMPIWIGVAAALGVALAIGIIQSLLITRMGLQPFIVTLAGMLIIRGISQTITGGGNISFGNSDFRDLADQGIHIRSLMIPYPVLMFMAVAAIATYLLHFTVFGRHVYAIGGNREAAEYSGLPVKRIEASTYIISAGLAGLAGIPYAAYIGQMSHSVGEAYELTAIAAAVLGGCSLRGGEGTIFGVIIGSAIMKVMDNGINMFKIGNWRLDENWRNMIIGGVILGAIVLDQVTYLLQARRNKQKVG